MATFASATTTTPSFKDNYHHSSLNDNHLVMLTTTIATPTLMTLTNSYINDNRHTYPSNDHHQHRLQQPIPSLPRRQIKATAITSNVCNSTSTLAVITPALMNTVTTPAHLRDKQRHSNISSHHPCLNDYHHLFGPSQRQATPLQHQQSSPLP